MKSDKVQQRLKWHNGTAPHFLSFLTGPYQALKEGLPFLKEELPPSYPAATRVCSTGLFAQGWTGSSPPYCFHQDQMAPVRSTSSATTLNRTGRSLSPGVKWRGFGCVHKTKLVVLGLQHVEALRF